VVWVPASSPVSVTVVLLVHGLLALLADLCTLFEFVVVLFCLWKY
jgi:hypothetical protein